MVHCFDKDVLDVCLGVSPAAAAVCQAGMQLCSLYCYGRPRSITLRLVVGAGSSPRVLSAAST